MDDVSLNRLCAFAKVQQPEGLTLLPEHWSTAKASRLGGLRHVELYGNPATRSGRSLGGQNAQRRFRANPEFYHARGVAVRKSVRRPYYSGDVAELVGILLGDGSIRARQVTISSNVLDADHAAYIQDLVLKLFGLQMSQGLDMDDHTITLTASSTELVECLVAMGLHVGDKVRQQVDVPNWVWRKREFEMGCLRGLMDTDGCVYRHAYQVNGTRYRYTKLAFTSASAPLLHSVKRMFEHVGVFPSLHRDGRRLYLHDSNGVKKYFDLVGTHNPRYLYRYRSFADYVQERSHSPVECGGLLNRCTGEILYRGFESLPLR